MKSAFLVTVDPNSQDGSVEFGYDHRFAETRRTPIDVDVASSLIAAFADLPSGGGALCFYPVLVVEIRNHDNVQWAGAACFDCGTYYSTDGRARMVACSTRPLLPPSNCWIECVHLLDWSHSYFEFVVSEAPA